MKDIELNIIELVNFGSCAIKHEALLFLSKISVNQSKISLRLPFQVGWKLITTILLCSCKSLFEYTHCLQY